MYYHFESRNGSFVFSESRRIVVGFNPLVVCEENNEHMEAKQLYELLHHIFLRFGVVSVESLYLMFTVVFLHTQHFEFLDMYQFCT